MTKPLTVEDANLLQSQAQDETVSDKDIFEMLWSQVIELDNTPDLIHDKLFSIYTDIYKSRPRVHVALKIRLGSCFCDSEKNYKERNVELAEDMLLPKGLSYEEIIDEVFKSTDMAMVERFNQIR